jgi:hypothetical protein
MDKDSLLLAPFISIFVVNFFLYFIVVCSIFLVLAATALKAFFAQFPTARRAHSGNSYCQMKENNPKKSPAPFATVLNLFIAQLPAAVSSK